MMKAIKKGKTMPQLPFLFILPHKKTTDITSMVSNQRIELTYQLYCKGNAEKKTRQK